MEYKKLKALVDQGSLEYSQYLEQAALALGLAVERKDSMLVLKTPIELLLPAVSYTHLPLPTIYSV